MVRDILHATLAYSILENFQKTWTSEDEDKDKDLKIGPRGSSRTTLHNI